jgi:hypothetical protein
MKVITLHYRVFPNCAVSLNLKNLKPLKAQMILEKVKTEKSIKLILCHCNQRIQGRSYYRNVSWSMEN